MGARNLMACPWLAVRELRRRLSPPAYPRAAFRILLFHRIAPAMGDGFGRLISYLADSGGFIDPTEAAHRLREGGDDFVGRPPPVLLSFDDGFASNAELAHTVLAERGIRALFFVCPGLVDLAGAAQNEAVLRQVFRGHTPEAGIERLMSWKDLAALTAAGHVIGAHGLTHTRLTGLDADALEDEVSGAADALAARLDVTPDWFAYPFGDIDSIDDSALAAIGRRFQFCRSGVRGLNVPGGHKRALFADSVDCATGTAWQRLAAGGALDFRYRAARDRLAALAEAADRHAAP